MREHAADSPLAEPSGDACDSYHRYSEDMSLLSGAGLTAYRFSLEWSRIEPERGAVSRASIDHYRRMVETCHSLNLTPVVTLHHFTLPRWLADVGGWRCPESPDLFARYTEAALQVVADGVEWVCTINEPNMIAKDAGAEHISDLAPDAHTLPDPGVSTALLRAHQRSREVLSTLPAIKSGWAVATQAYQPEPGCEENASIHAYPREDLFLEGARGDDFIGVQAYTRTIIGPDGPKLPGPGVETTLTGWEYYPAAAAQGARRAWKLTGQVPLLVTENGVATTDDARRIAYTRDALAGLHDAMADGVDVRGYLHWSALDNYEWGRYDPTFGLIAVDRMTFKRTPKPSLYWLGDISRTGTLHLRE